MVGIIKSLCKSPLAIIFYYREEMVKFIYKNKIKIG